MKDTVVSPTGIDEKVLHRKRTKTYIQIISCKCGIQADKFGITKTTTKNIYLGPIIWSKNET